MSISIPEHLLLRTLGEMLQALQTDVGTESKSIGYSDTMDGPVVLVDPFASDDGLVVNEENEDDENTLLIIRSPPPAVVVGEAASVNGIPPVVSQAFMGMVPLNMLEYMDIPEHIIAEAIAAHGFLVADPDDNVENGSWHLVTVGADVGVFKSGEYAVSVTTGVSGNVHRKVATRRKAQEGFIVSWCQGNVRRVQ
ncbi:hypothetical protein BDN72DRAFT_901251 [Pluteus cervinus]|uniref:Uncharacterized protein n=1 Tax=Pluteus cervinus TaxID=181527 RepID=A0ACD3AIX5_9AGAR|nr:hypothetical protein BDN72DRAFT_901251 [Pluteus cervinus]